MAKNVSQKKVKGAKPTPLVYDQKKMFEFFVATVEAIRRDWDALSNLFLNAKRRTFLHKNVPQLADRISTLLTASVYMGLVQLFDPPETFNKPENRNLVLRRVIDDLAPPVGTSERHQIESDYNAMTPTVKLMKQWRNIMGAHRSLKIAIEVVDFIRGRREQHPLPWIPLMEVRNTLECLVNITDALVSHIHGPGQGWYQPVVIREVDQIFEAIGLSSPVS